MRPFPEAPVATSVRNYDPDVIVVRAGAGLFAELVLTSVVRDLPTREFTIINGTPRIWEQFHNARTMEDYGTDSTVAWNPFTPILCRATGHDVFQIAADRVREAGIVVDRGPSLCHIPIGPLFGRGLEPGGVLLALSGTPGTTEMVPREIQAEIEKGLTGKGVRFSTLSGDFFLDDAIAAVISARVIVCTHGPVHLLAGGAHLLTSPTPIRDTVLLTGGAWPSGAIPGRRQVSVESWHKVSCSGGGCGALLAGPGPESTDRCRNCASGYPDCLQAVDPKEVVEKVISLLGL